MAAYAHRCRTCDTGFEVHRPMDAPAGEVRCPAGHTDVARVWSAVAVVAGRGSARGAAPVPAPVGGGGCCGGGCCG